MTERIGFFNVDTQQPREHGQGLIFRPRVQPIEDRLHQLLKFAERGEWPLVSTACVHAGPIEPALDDTVLFIPIEAPKEQWRPRLDGCRKFFLEKRTCGSREVNVSQRAFDVFHSNPNAPRLIRALDVEHWIVFGDSAAYCVLSTARGLLDLNLAVTVLTDAVAPGGASLSEAEDAMRELEGLGASLLTVNDFLRIRQ